MQEFDSSSPDWGAVTAFVRRCVARKLQGARPSSMDIDDVVQSTILNRVLPVLAREPVRNLGAFLTHAASWEAADWARNRKRDMQWITGVRIDDVPITENEVRERLRLRFRLPRRDSGPDDAPGTLRRGIS